MNVVRHDAPRVEVIAVAVEAQERRLHDGACCGRSQQPLAMAGVEKSLETFAAEGGHLVRQCFQHNVTRQGVREPEGDRLRVVSGFPMRQAAA